MDSLELARRARRAALHDPLTGTETRRAGYHHLRDLSDLADPFAVLMVDLDHLKPINDSLGHDAGDMAIRWGAQQIAWTLEPDARIFRWGGDEFVVTLPGEELLERSQAAARNVNHALTTAVVPKTAARISASIGIALSLGRDADEVLRAADAACYAAKKERGTYSVEPARSDGHCRVRARADSGIPWCDFDVSVLRDNGDMQQLRMRAASHARVMAKLQDDALERWGMVTIEHAGEVVRTAYLRKDGEVEDFTALL